MRTLSKPEPSADIASLGSAGPRLHVTYRGARPSMTASLRRFLSFAGPGLLIAVGYVDPGNWATDLAAGSRFSYALLSVVLISSVMAVLLQVLSLRLGIAAGQDLAEACRDAYPRAAIPLWLLAETAMIATDLAEVIGSAIALQLLFGLPLAMGVVITVADVLLLLALERRGIRRLELCVGALLLIVAACFSFELLLSRPNASAVLAGYLPTTAIFRDRNMLYVAVGIVGATVMPHNLYLHSSLVQTRAFERTDAGKRSAIRHSTLDTILSLGCAMLVNSAILVVAAAVFHRTGHVEVAEIGDAHRLLAPLLGSAVAGTVFAIALLAAGQSATITGTLAGQIVMSGFVRVRMRPWARRLVTRGLAIIPALAGAIYFGANGTGDMLVASQVILGLQLPFAVVPLLLLTADQRRMGRLTAPRWMSGLGWLCAVVIIALNLYLVASLACGG